AAGATCVGEVLQRLPAQGNATNLQDPGGAGSIRIDLRGLGARRTRVLINGHRIVSSGAGADDAVDLGTIPLAMIERVEVMRSGGSEIDDRDAVAGVVNLVTRTRLPGSEAIASASTSQRADAARYDLSFATGQESSEGGAVFSLGYQRQQPAMARDRAWTSSPSSLDYLVMPESRVQLFSTGDYKLARRTSAFFEASFDHRESAQQAAEGPLVLAQLGRDGSPLGLDAIAGERALAGFGARTAEQVVDTSWVVVGVRGTIAEPTPVIENWVWQVAYDHGRSTSSTTRRGDLVVSRLARSLGPRFDDPARGPSCGTPSAPLDDGCVPLVLDTPEPVSPAALDYLTFTGTASGLDEQHAARIMANGRLVELPHHGDISFGVAGDYRFERISSTPDPVSALGDTTGGLTAPTAGTSHTFEAGGELSIVPVAYLRHLSWVELDAAGRAFHDDAFGTGTSGKLSALVRGHALAIRGTYGTAVRTPSLAERFAGQADHFLAIPDPCDSTGRAAAPTGQTAAECARQGVADPFDPGAPLVRARLGGNRDLRPETATVATAGIVYERGSLFGVTLDYWRTEIDRAIETLPPATILAQCYQGGMAGACSQIEREPVSHAIRQVLDLPRNVHAVTTSGLDLVAALQHRGSPGILQARLEASYLFQYNIDTGAIDPQTRMHQILRGRGVFDLGVHPDLKLDLSTRWSRPQWGTMLGANVRFVDSFSACDHDGCNEPATSHHEVSRYVSADLFLAYKLYLGSHATTFTAGVNNLADARPPAIIGAAPPGSDPSTYDFVGRQIFLRVGDQF
ncbi:MAG TPA: TonB-dependent receptor, partial [Kofleriaceae bacterium]|nr:TonB-dependent receptor [Kofleriaceae bacterium]